MISWRMVAAWVAALVLATVLTWQIVGLADSQVGEPVVAVAPSLTSSSVVETTTTTSPSSTTTTALTTTTSTPGPTSGSAPTSGSSSSSTPSSTSSTSTTAEAEWSVRTITSIGGSVVVRYRPEEVELQAATPAPGFAVEIDDDGPERVRVEFDGNDIEARIEARWENGDLDVDIDEND